LREEFLDHVALESPAAAQAAIDAWVASYNRSRTHQALDMATPASLFRPNGPTRLDVAANIATSSGGITSVEDAPEAAGEVAAPAR
jgi:hypothetical protein